MSQQLIPKSLTALLGFMLLLVAGCRDEFEIAVNTGDPVPLANQAGAPIFQGRGDFSLPITTTDPHAQRYFDQGMVLAFGFNHAESIRSFRAAQTLDPDCAMCFWGEALATGPNINVTNNGKAVMTSAEEAPVHADAGTLARLSLDQVEAVASASPKRTALAAPPRSNA